MLLLSLLSLPLTVAFHFPRARTSFPSSPFSFISAYHLVCSLFPAPAIKCSYRTGQDGQPHNDAIRHGQLGVMPNCKLFGAILARLACPIRRQHRPVRPV